MDSDGILVAPIDAKMSSEQEGHGVDKCIELTQGVDDNGWCSSANDDNDPWILFTYPAEANIQKINIVNRNDASAAVQTEANARITGATIQFSRDEAGMDVLWSDKFGDAKQAYSWDVKLDLGMG